jgi:hypothetical protein
MILPTGLVVYPRGSHGITEYHLKERLTRNQDRVTRHTLGDAGRKTTSP